ncbi:CybS-domain-containing protein [Zychaea mexicana]|uniref:CybS-domain-containing protein n=1 Tax=Zychaea mexicana TaxID=64656 RepID=UPI0022FE5AE5|nr:CybS-domain-containing protein [Zychaea mexicana]KAI9495594.1 CybS-domain-containing protein [Zychaea mexicana]
MSLRLLSRAPRLYRPRTAFAIRPLATVNNNASSPSSSTPASAGAGTEAAAAISNPILGTPPKEEPAADTIVKKEEEGDNKNKKEGVAAPNDKNGYEHGAYLWTLERVGAVGLIPLFTTQAIYGAHPICDGLLGVILPFHLYLGMESCIIDYVPKREYPRMHRAANWALMGTTGLVMWGCFEFNTNEIGLTELIQRCWTA